MNKSIDYSNRWSTERSRRKMSNPRSDRINNQQNLPYAKRRHKSHSPNSKYIKQGKTTQKISALRTITLAKSVT